MIWQIAHVYHQQPVLRDLVALYANVAAAAMLGSIVKDSATGLIGAMASAARKAGQSTIESTSAGVRDLGSRMNPFKPKGQG